MFFYIAYGVLWPIFHLLFPYRIIGKEKLQQYQGGCVICANHISLFDPVFLVYLLTRKRRVHIMAKQELFKSKLSAWFFRHVGAFPVNRGAGAEGIKTAEGYLRAGESLLIFPEGTRSKDGKLGKAKAGAAMLVTAFNASVLPISIVTKNQKVRPFRKTLLIIGDPVEVPPAPEGVSQREHLRLCTAAIMEPIAEGIKEYEQ